MDGKKLDQETLEHVVGGMITKEEAISKALSHAGAKKKGYNPESLANVCRQPGINPRWL